MFTNEKRVFVVVLGETLLQNEPFVRNFSASEDGGQLLSCLYVANFLVLWPEDAEDAEDADPHHRILSHALLTLKGLTAI